MWDFFKQASPLFKVQLIFFALVAVFSALIGLSYLNGSIEIKHGVEPDRNPIVGDYACSPAYPEEC